MIGGRRCLLRLRCGARLLLACAAEPLDAAGKSNADCLGLGVCEAEAIIDALVPASGEPIALSKLSHLVPDHVHEHLDRGGISLRSHFAARAEKFCCSRDANNMIVVRRTQNGGAALPPAVGAVCIPPAPPPPSSSSIKPPTYCGANDGVAVPPSSSTATRTTSRNGGTKLSFTDVWNAPRFADRCLVEEWADVAGATPLSQPVEGNRHAGGDVAPLVRSLPTPMSQRRYSEPYFPLSGVKTTASAATMSLATTPPRLISVAALLESALRGAPDGMDTQPVVVRDGEESAFLRAVAVQPNVRRCLFVKSICRDSLAAVERGDDAGVIVYDDPLVAGSPVLASPERFLTLVSLTAAAQLNAPNVSGAADAVHASPCSTRHAHHFASTSAGLHAAQHRYFPQDYDAFRLARTLAVETVTPLRAVVSRAVGMLRGDDVAAALEVTLAFPELFDCCDGAGKSVPETRAAHGVCCRRTIHGLRYRVHPRFLGVQRAAQTSPGEFQVKKKTEVAGWKTRERLKYIEESRFHARLQALKESLVPECDPDVLAYALYDALEPHARWPPETGVAPALLSAAVQQRTNGRSKKFLARYPDLFRIERFGNRHYLCRSEWAKLTSPPTLGGFLLSS